MAKINLVALVIAAVISGGIAAGAAYAGASVTGTTLAEGSLFTTFATTAGASFVIGGGSSDLARPPR